MGERTELRFAAPQITISLGSRSKTLRLEKLPDLGFCIPSGFDFLDIGGAWGKFSAGFPDDADIHFIGKADGTVAQIHMVVDLVEFQAGFFAKLTHGTLIRLLARIDQAGREIVDPASCGQAEFLLKQDFFIGLIGGDDDDRIRFGSTELFLILQVVIAADHLVDFLMMLSGLVI